MECKEYRKLHAEWYEIATSRKDHTKELTFWEQSIRESGEPALELGSGTGKVLIPMLERGIDIRGIDTSEDMMERCRAACEAKGLTAELHEQSMTEFDLPDRFGTIILPSGSLCLFVEDRDIRDMFERVMHHLKPGGRFVFDFSQVRVEKKEKADKGNDRWRDGWWSEPDGRVIAWRRKHDYDPATHTWEELFIVEKYVDGRFVEAEANERVGREFFVEEVVEFAREAGFEEIRATNLFSDDPPSRDAAEITVRCRKPGVVNGERQTKDGNDNERLATDFADSADYTDCRKRNSNGEAGIGGAGEFEVRHTKPGKGGARVRREKAGFVRDDGVCWDR
jgi:SAM-dependent methyltransferase